MNNFENELEDESLFEHYKIVADPNQGPVRLDKFLLDRIEGVSRNRIQNGIKGGYVKIDNEVINKANFKIRPDQQITVSLPHPPRNEDLKPEALDLNIPYEDEEILIVNKEPGMVVHPAYQNWSGTLVNALAWHFQNLPTMPNNEGRPGLVHRIDKDTSGLLVIAKSQVAMTSLAKQFFDHSIERTYYALIWGEPFESKGTIDVNLGRSLKDRRITAAFPEGDFGRNAVTHYEVIKEMRYVSLIKCNLETGRTHQIRAHMKHMGHPIFNDATYGGDKVLKGTTFTKYKQFVDNCFKIIPRQSLHAKSLGFIHPTTNKFVQFDSELPEDFQSVIEKWENYVNTID